LAFLGGKFLGIIEGVPCGMEADLEASVVDFAQYIAKLLDLSLKVYLFVVAEDRIGDVGFA
jgi:hypothetical protein